MPHKPWHIAASGANVVLPCAPFATCPLEARSVDHVELVFRPSSRAQTPGAHRELPRLAPCIDID